MKSYSKAEILEMERFYRANFVNSLGGFKSACLLGTRNPQTKVDNLCIINSVVQIGANPPYLGFVFRPHTVERHSVDNIMTGSCYTLSHIQRHWMDKAHQTAAKFHADTSEFEAVGLTPYNRPDFEAPAVTESALRMGFQLEERHDIQLNGTILMIGSLQWVELDHSAVAEDGFVDLARLGSITNVSLDGYYEASLLARYAYARPEKAPSQIGPHSSKSS